MKRLWIILALLLTACATPTEPSPPPDTPTPTQPTPTQTPTSPTNTPTLAASDTPPGPLGLWALLFDAQQAWREVGIDAAGLPPVDLRPEMVEADDCPVDCAGFFYPTESGAVELTITMIAFEDEDGASMRVGDQAQDLLANGAREVALSDTAVGIDYLPDGYRVFYLDQSWSVLAPYGSIFVGVTLEWTVEYDQPLPEDDIISFSHVTAQAASAQIEKLIEAGY
jgi:hypothetical protein